MGRGGTADAPRQRQKAKTVGVIRMAEVQKHAQPQDAWLVYRNKVYDVSGWTSHPGGRVIFSHAGRDATDTFNGFHPGSAYSLMEQFYIGDLHPSDRKVSPFERDYQRLRARIYKLGLHKASAAYYTFKVLSTFALWAIGAWFIVASAGSWSSVFVGTFFIALFWQQSGWLSHDFMHHQVCSSRSLADHISIVLGNLWQGFSVAWWKDKHNTHHAIPNLHESTDGRHDGDPDIDTMPILAWSLNMAKKAQSSGTLGRFFVKYQAFVYFPILLVARMSWVAQSFMFAFRIQSNWNQELGELRLKYLEYTGLILYYAWNVAFMCCLPWGQAAFYLFGSQMMCGFLLAIAFGVGHNGMATYEFDTVPEWGEWQITTTRNVHGNWLVGWFMGGLHHQIEHHLFPDVPRHNLHKLRAMVEPLCKTHGIPYRSTTLWEGTCEVLQHLAEVTTEIVTEFPAM